VFGSPFSNAVMHTGALLRNIRRAFGVASRGLHPRAV